MTKLLVVTTFAAVAFAAYPAAACDWNRQASSSDPAVATTATSAQQTTTQTASQAATTSSQTASETARKPVDAPAPVVLVTERH